MKIPGCKTSFAKLFGAATLVLLMGLGAPLVAQEKKDEHKKEEHKQEEHKQERTNTPPPQAPRTTPQTPPQQQSAPAPAYHPPTPPQGNPSGQPSSGSPNYRRDPNGQPSGQPNGSPTSSPGNSPNNSPNTGRPGYQPNGSPGNSPNTGRPSGSQPTTTQPTYNPNGGRPANTTPGGGNPGYNRPANGVSNSGQPAGNPNGRYSGGANPRGGTLDSRRLPPGQVTRNPNGTSTFRGTNNSVANFRRDGSVREVRTRDVVITHGPGGSRQVFADRGDHRVVLTSRSNGYVERPFNVQGHAYVNRTYYAHGVSYSRAYRSYAFGGVSYYAYVPAFYYGPGFYGWVYSPWRTPVSYRWGWAGSPWYGYYGGYFAPYQSYPNASLWLTDYILAASLDDAYRQRQDAQAAGYQQGYADASGNGGQVALSSDVKQAIANEVQRQLQQEQAEGQAVAQNPNGDAGYSSAPPLFTDNNAHVFVVSASLELTTADGQDCAVTEGDVLGTSGPPPPNVTSTSVRVLASKGGDCPKSSVVAVQLVDLQEMQNQMRASMDQGLQDLQAHKGGLPAPPADALRGQVQSPVAASAPPPDANVSAELSQQDQQASQAEQDVVGQNAPDAGDSGAQPGTITLNQTVDDVVAILGKPTTVVDLGAKKIYVYKNMKVTFTNGRVTDVQ
jgi:hypothetical protein